MRARDPLEVPYARRIVGAAALLVGGAVLIGWLPFDARVFGFSMILLALGLLA